MNQRHSTILHGKSAKYEHFLGMDRPTRSSLPPPPPPSIHHAPAGNFLDFVLDLGNVVTIARTRTSKDNSESTEVRFLGHR